MAKLRRDKYVFSGYKSDFINFLITLQKLGTGITYNTNDKMFKIAQNTLYIHIYVWTEQNV